MINLISLTSLTFADVFELTVFSTIVGFAIGYVADAVMQDRGFGLIGNGILSIIGAMISLSFAHGLLSRFEDHELIVGSGVGLLGAMTALLALAAIKNRAFD